MSEHTSAGVDTLFIHGADRGYLVAAIRDGSTVLRGKLGLSETSAGPRPGRFRVLTNGSETPRPPDEFVEIARRAQYIRVSEQTDAAARQSFMSMLAGYQLDADVVRTCRICSTAGRFSPITADSAITVNDGQHQICPECAFSQLNRELTLRGDITGGARERLRELVLQTQDLDRVINLLQGRLDPDLTKFDVISPTVTDADPVMVKELDIHPKLKQLLSNRFEELLPVQSMAVRNDLLGGEDQLVISATATGKTLIGEIAGIHRVLSGNGKLLFLVPLVALANQKHDDFEREYGDLVDVTIRVGASRIRDSGHRFDRDADVIVGTYEGIDHALRIGRDLGDIGTVVIDEVHMLHDADRGHRLDGLIARLREYCNQRAIAQDHYEGAQWIYLSATVGNPAWLGDRFGARVIEFEERPVPIERHVTFASRYDKPDIIDTLVKREFDTKSSKGYRGQTIVFTNSRRRCHELSRRIGSTSAAYHSGLDYGQRKSVERKFAEGDIAAVVTTAALGAGVDFPASQVIFDSLAMGIEWLTVQEFYQMLGRAGRPDYHDRGTVYLIVEPNGQYHRGMERTEDEVAFTLLKGEMGDVRPTYDDETGAEELLANVVVGGSRAKRITDRMIGEISIEHSIQRLLTYGFIDGVNPTPLGRAVAIHFLTPDEAFIILDGIKGGKDPFDIVAERELLEVD